MKNRDPQIDSLLKMDVIHFLKGSHTLGLKASLVGFLVTGVGFFVASVSMKTGVAIMFLGFLLALGGLIYFFFERREAGSESTGGPNK